MQKAEDMTQPHGTQIDLARQFPRDRKEAERISELIRQQALAAGCTCKQIKIDFIEPPFGKPFVQVGHDVLCVLSHP